MAAGRGCVFDMRLSGRLYAPHAIISAVSCIYARVFHPGRGGCMTNPIGRAPVSNIAFVPPQINSLEDTGLSPLWLQDLVLKLLYSRGYLTGFKIAEEITLPFAGVTDQLLTSLKQEKLIEVKSSQGGLGEGAYTYGITGAGNLHAREALDRSQYAGPAPVPFEVD